MNAKIINSRNLTMECWLIQAFGKSHCKSCESKGTKNCGGKNIIKSGKNSKGIKVPI